ncbi:Sterile alpha motif domain-containing protein 9 [Stylophora pistillata]|uniref:Sterile alpha motif domain-containing protein 9 n=1 Tax=Stylophora pistillata TaxID=50429 RepID=A0A2B4R8T1_STYPI|nr:Sterile alpha motif domain-containing protein 9 [Stylophora pistillata]
MMHIEKSKLFLCGLPPDCQGSTLKDFLEGVYGFPGVITKVCIPSEKTYAFVTASQTEVVDYLLRTTLLYCDGNGQFYQIKACQYKKPQYKTNHQRDNLPNNKSQAFPTGGADSQPAKYTPPHHVHQLSPDYSMLSFSKPKRRRNRDDSIVWFCGVGSTTLKRKHKMKKKKKKRSSRLVVLESESFQFDDLCPEGNNYDVDGGKPKNTTGQDEPMVAQVAGQESTKQHERIPECLVNKRSHTQVIINHCYLGPLCLQLSIPSAVADVKAEIMERTGLPVKSQALYFNGKKLCDDLCLEPLFGDHDDSLALTLFEGSLKGGVRPMGEQEQAEGAVGGEIVPVILQKDGETLSMEKWDSNRTAAWLDSINLGNRYSNICRREDISGRALLLLASSNNAYLLVSTLKLKEGPKLILMDELERHLKMFEPDKTQAGGTSTESINGWTCEELCYWLRDLGIPQEYLNKLEDEEMSGRAFLLLKKSGRMKESLQLKEGPWIVLQHVLPPHEVRKNESATKDNSLPSMVTKGLDKSVELPASDDVIMKNTSDTSPKPALTEEERLLLLGNALKLDIHASKTSKDSTLCKVRSIFHKRDGANALEGLFIFVVITKETILSKDCARRLWKKIIGNTNEWLRFLTKEDLETFWWDKVSRKVVQKPTNEELSLRDGQVSQMCLAKLSDEELKNSYFILLIDKQLLGSDTKTNRFSWDGKDKEFYDMNLNLDSCYHAAFDVKNPSQDPKFSKYVKSLRSKESYSEQNDSSPAEDVKSQKPLPSNAQYEDPRSFGAGCGRRYYTQGWVLNCWETGTIDMITPVHEFKILQAGIQSNEDVNLMKFVRETLRFACACLNVRTNGTIHFGVADENKSKACGNKPREIVGLVVFNKPLVNEKLIEYIGKCFVGESRIHSCIYECIRPPVFIPVRSSSAEEKVVIEVDIEPTHSLCVNKIFTACFKGLEAEDSDRGASAYDFLDKTFHFIQNIEWSTIFDFDDQGSYKRGLCKVFMSGINQRKVEIRQAEDYEADDKATENILYNPSWIFGNGYSELLREAKGFRQWHNSERKRGLSQVIQSLSRQIPRGRAVVLFLLLSKDYKEVMDVFEEFCTYLDGPNQLIYAAESPDIVGDWEERLSKTCIEKHHLPKRGIVGMSWTEFRESMLLLANETNRDQRYVIMAKGNPFPMGKHSFNRIDILSARECEELTELRPEERLNKSLEVELDFYQGEPVKWMNFWFTDEQRNHVLRRDNYSELKTLIENMYSLKPKEKVQTITIYHHIGAGASTMARQALWDFRCNSQFPYRCAVVKKIDSNTCNEMWQLRKIGHGEDTKGPIPPVLALVDDTEDVLFRELRLQVIEQTNRSSETQANLPVCVFLYCKQTQKPLECYQKENTSSVYLQQRLSEKEVKWFEDKYTEMKQQLEGKAPENDFDKYANENLISFMIMKENYNPNYTSSVVARNLDLVTGNEVILLKYCSLLTYNPYPVFVSCFDTIMVHPTFLRKRTFRDWVEDLTHSARIFLREKDRSTDSGSGKAISIVHPVIASELLDQIAEKEGTTLSQIAEDFLESTILSSDPKSFTSADLLYGVNRMLKHRRKLEYGDEEETKFSPLIEKILNVKRASDGKEEPTIQSIHKAACVLRKGFDKFKDPWLAQQMARVFYLHATVLPNPDECFDNALQFCNEAIRMTPNNSFLFDTKGRIYQTKMKVLFGPIRKENRIVEIAEVTPVLPLAFEAMKWFEKSLATSVDNENKYGFNGQLYVMFYLLDVIRCAKIFRGPEGLKKLQEYLVYCQVIPPEVESPWREYHKSFRELSHRFSLCMEGIVEDFTIFKENSAAGNRLPKLIARFKAQYLSYFSKGEVEWNMENPEERRECRWQEINHYLAGDIFSSVFKIDQLLTEQQTPQETLKRLKDLAHEDYADSSNTDYRVYKDLLLYIATSMALHSPYSSTSKSKKAELVEEEYREIYRFVDSLVALEQQDERFKRLYAHLLKVMFLWPRKKLELTNYRVKDFNEALTKLKTRWAERGKGETDGDKMLKQNMYKHMPFKKLTRQYTTLFYLGKGSGLDVFVHINELKTSRGSVDFEHSETRDRLKRLTGVVAGKNVIRVKNPLELSESIDVYYSDREGGFSKEEVLFYLGFSWHQPIALDVKYTSREYVQRSMVLNNLVSAHQTQYPSAKKFMTYDKYTSKLGKLRRKIKEIQSLKEQGKQGEKLDENQKKKISKEEFFKSELQLLEGRLDFQEEEMFD